MTLIPTSCKLHHRNKWNDWKPFGTNSVVQLQVAWKSETFKSTLSGNKSQRQTYSSSYFLLMLETEENKSKTNPILNRLYLLVLSAAMIPGKKRIGAQGQTVDLVYFVDFGSFSVNNVPPAVCTEKYCCPSGKAVGCIVISWLGKITTLKPHNLLPHPVRTSERSYRSASLGVTCTGGVHKLYFFFFLQ